MSLSPGNVDDVIKDLSRGLKLIKKKQPEYQKREDYYQGVRKEIITHPKLKRLLAQYQDAFGLNYAAVPCDAMLDRIDLMSLTTGDPATDALLIDRLWDPNSLEDDSDDYHLHASYLGDYYVVAEYISDQDDQDDEDGETGAGVGTIELTPKHPNCMVVVYQRSNSRIPDFAVQMVEGDEDGDWDALVYYDDETWTFTSQDGGAGDGFNADQYVIDLDVDDFGTPVPIENEVGLFPVFHFRPDRKPYGQPVNQKMYGPQDAITKINATAMAAMDYYGFPQRWRLLDASTEADDSIDNDWGDDGGILSTGLVNPDRPAGGSKLTADPGGLWELPGGGSIGQFNPADPKGFLDPLAFQIRSGATLSRTPLYEFDLDGSAEMSGEARRRADAPITKHAAKLKGQFGNVWSAIGAYTLAVLKRESAKRVEAVWAPSETATDKEGFELVASKIENGIPPRQALLEAGYTQAQVDDFLPIDETDGLAMPMSPKMVMDLATALRDLGTAKNLGAVSDDSIKRIFRPYIGDQIEFEDLPQHQEERITDTVTAAAPLNTDTPVAGAVLIPPSALPVAPKPFGR